MKIHIPHFDKARVLVVGDVMLDRYWHGATSRISPEAPVPVVRVEEAEDRPGGAANVALNIAALGAHADLVGVTGEDEAATILARRLEAADVNCSFERLNAVPTITKLRVISRHQQLIRLDFEGGLPGFTPDVLLVRMQRALPAADVVVFSDYGKGTLAAIGALIAAARAAGKPVLVDPKSRAFGIYRGATLVTPNLAAQNFEALLSTRGEHGMTLLQRGREALHLPARAREVYDVTGAGDTVISALAAALAAGESLPQATAFANLAAGIVVGKLGTATVSVPEIRRALREDFAPERGVVSEQQLLAAVDDARAHGEIVVMTNGCFDILHAGHVAYLEEARKLGDRLIVAVNDDASARRLKGAARPVNPRDQRMAVLAALKSVDWVVPFSEDTPERLICAVRPRYLVKGGDYRPEQIAGHRCVAEHGGEVVVLKFMEGHSTTRIIERCKGET